jgi:hypothetical protein
MKPITVDNMTPREVDSHLTFEAEKHRRETKKPYCGLQNFSMLTSTSGLDGFADDCGISARKL